MTPQERIAQLAAERGGVATFPRPARPGDDNCDTEIVPARPQNTRQKPTGFDVALSLSWRRIPDDWANRDQIGRLQRLEVYLAAGVICRWLGPEWHRELNPDARGGQCRIIHREGWGFRIGRCWQEDSRFSVSALEQYKRGEPPSITVSATRPLGAIAADIQRRLIGNGLRKAWEQSQSSDRARQNERKARFDQLRAVAEAWGGRIDNRRRWEHDGYPTASIPGGTVKTYYDERLQIELCLTTDEAVRLGDLTRKATE